MTRPKATTAAKVAKYSKQKTIFIILGGFIALAVVWYLLPLPFKPSLWLDIDRANIMRQLDNSSDPVYLPELSKTATYGGITYHSAFTSFDGWRNAYFVQLIGEGYYFQLSPRSQIGTAQNVANEYDVSMLKSIQNGSACKPESGKIIDCSQSIDQLGTLKYKVYKTDEYVLVAPVTQIQYSASSPSLRAFNSTEVDKVEAMVREAKPVPLSEARESRFRFM